MARIDDLIEGYLSATLSTQEVKEFLSLVDSGERSIKAGIDHLLASEDFAVLANGEREEIIYTAMMQRANVSKIIHRVHFLRTAWFRYAAAVILIMCAVTYLWLSSTSPERSRRMSSTEGTERSRSADAAPGTNKATLTLADGSTILLDSTRRNIVKQGRLTVVNENGKLDYEGIGASVEYHTLSTPKGGQYQLVLPDGSKVWLNAASSISYPTAFVGKERRVTITGEVYFEISAQRQKFPLDKGGSRAAAGGLAASPQPFIVLTSNGTQVQVLGTSFNINAYPDEDVIKTTLINGSVKVLSAGKGSLLKPGQEAVAGHTSLFVQSADIAQALAWRNGLFNFKSADIYSVMRQLSRWYNIDVKYAGKVPIVKISGKMDKALNLSEILDFLSKMGIKFSWEGKTLLVSGK